MKKGYEKVRKNFFNMTVRPKFEGRDVESYMKILWGEKEVILIMILHSVNDDPP